MNTTAKQTTTGKKKMTKTTSATILACCIVLALAWEVLESDGSTDSGNEGLFNSSSASADGKLVLHRKTVTDPSRQNMKSHTIYVPEGWKMDASVFNPHRAYFQILPSVKISVTSPEGIQAKINPTGFFSDPRPTAEYRNMYGLQRPRQHTRDGGTMVLYRPDSLHEWGTYFREVVIPERHPNARNIRITKVSEIKPFSDNLRSKSKTLIAQIQQKNQQARSYGLPETDSITIQGLMIEATFDDDGKEKEFMALAGVHSIESQIQGMVQVNWSVEPNLSFVAPVGKLEANLPVLYAISGSMRPTKAWQQEIQQYVARNTPRSSPRPRTTTANVGNTFSEILDISHNGYRSRSNNGDASQRKYVNSIHQTSDYTSGGTTYHLPAGYDHVYTDDFDTIVLTNDSLFNPNVDLNGSGKNWTKMSEH